MHSVLGMEREQPQRHPTRRPEIPLELDLRT
jgi:hypothetical protein